jgi:hypothetical protein
MRVKKQMKKVLYNVQCVYDEKHVFEKVFEKKTKKPKWKFIVPNAISW